MIAGLYPIDLLAAEAKKTYIGRHQAEVVVDRSKREVIKTWQERWDASDKGRWTHRLIPNIQKWLERRHGEVDFHTCQILSGHGCFRAYFYKIGLEEDSLCRVCDMGASEDVEHVLFVCPRFRTERDLIAKQVGYPLTSRNLMEVMLVSEENWMAVANFAASITKVLRRLVRS